MVRRERISQLLCEDLLTAVKGGDMVNLILRKSILRKGEETSSACLREQKVQKGT